MDLSEYLSLFIDESKDHLQAMNENVLSLESNPQDIGIVHNIFRSAHTLKGMSATMGYGDLAALTHEMENVLDLVRNYKLEMDSFIFDCIFKSLDALERMVEDVIQGGSGNADVTEIVASLKSVVSGEYKNHNGGVPLAQTHAGVSSGTEVDEFQYSVLQQSIESGHNVFYMEVAVREDCILKAARAYMVFDVLERSGDIVKATPSVQEIEQERFDRSFSVFYISTLEKAELEKEITSISEIESVQIVQVDQMSLSEMVGSAQTAIAESFTGAQQTAAAAVAEVQSISPATDLSKKPSTVQTSAAPVANRTIRVDIERLDTLMNLFSELLIDRVRLEQLAAEVKRADLTETVEHMSRVSSDLQNIVLKLRMVPVETVFNRFPRMVRDVAKSLSKKVDLVITGADTELDRTVIDEIGDPLVHLLRNSVDHGIESVPNRVAAGKSETGVIQLRAFHSGNHVFIEVEDDGAGINRPKVLERAVKNGIIPAERASQITEHEIDQLLFASGFSTADRISDISGRGVGLDVVKTKIESLGGSVQVESKPGNGSKFSVQLPLTLSIISAMLIRLGSEKYAIPLSSIVETAAVKRTSVYNVHGNRIIEFRGTVIPVISMGRVFEVPDYSEEGEAAMEVVIIRKGEKTAALVVDEFLGQQEIVLKSLGNYLTGLFAVSGATILGDGQVALIIDTNALIK